VAATGRAIVRGIPLLMLVAGCAHLAPPKPLALTSADNGRSMEMTIGQTLIVTLPWDPATGYRWQTVAEPDARTLIIVDSGFEQARSRTASPLKNPAEAGSHVPENPAEAGSHVPAGEAWWKLRATGTGSTSFTVRYVRPWEPEADPKPKEFTIAVEVKAREESG
jgi:inhibitor of cysteine peptidase